MNTVANFRKALGASSLLTLIAVLSPSTQAAVTTSSAQWLAAFYTETNGVNWTTNTNWGNGDPCLNNWHGITCDPSDSFVTDFEMVNNNLVGSIPAGIAQALPELESFEIRTNYDVEGPVPDFSDMAELDRVYIYGTKLSGSIPPLTNLPKLTTFVLGGSQVSGQVPAINALPLLQQFTLQDNRLTGTIPSLSGMGNLRSLNLIGNRLIGPIPDLSDLTSLINLHLRDNNLTGSIPASLSGLPELARVTLAGNQLTGAPPTPPTNLLANESTLCSNYLSAAATAAIDTAWDAATGNTPWNTNCDPLQANFAQVTIAVDGANGTVSPMGTFDVQIGSTLYIDSLPDQGFTAEILPNNSCGTPVMDLGTYSITPSQNCTIRFRFVQPTTTPTTPATAPTPVPVDAPWALAGTIGAIVWLGRRKKARHSSSS